jgi:hypothetical protein
MAGAVLVQGGPQQQVEKTNEADKLASHNKLESSCNFTNELAS